MKKTLIALAAVAATGAVMAQSTVTLSGKFGVAYTATKAANNGTKTNGFGVTDGDVVFTAVEDLGAGMKAGASIAVRTRGRQASPSANTSTGALTGVGSIDGRDSTVFLSGGFGEIRAGAVESANGIIGLASAGAPVIGQDSNVTLDGGTNVDWFAYYTPVMSGFRATVQISDSIGAPGAGGLQNGSSTQDGTMVGLSYADGPLAISADYTSFGQNAVAAASATDNRFRVSGSYDLGVAKLGLGYQSKEGVSANTDDQQYMVGVSVPLGTWTLGATYAARDNDTNSLDATGWEVGANYAFSKRTNLQIAYRSLEKDTDTKAATDLRIRLMHSF